MEELDFFEEICLTSLYSSKAVLIAAVVNSNGRSNVDNTVSVLNVY